MKIQHRIVVFDAADIAAESAFWAGLLDGETVPDGEWHSIKVDGEWVMGVQHAPNHVKPQWPTTDGGQQQQIHLDLHVADLDAAVARATELGATQVQPPQAPADNPDGDERFTVLASPAGHLFCLGSYGSADKDKGPRAEQPSQPREPVIFPTPANPLGYAGAQISKANFAGAQFQRTNFSGASIRHSTISGLSMRSVDLDGLDIDSHDLFFGKLMVNGVDVVPLVDAELNRLFPGRELQKAQDPDGLRRGWDAARSAWQDTVDTTPRSLWDAHVDDEWSLAQTLRHLILATDAWLRGGIQKLDQPFHEIGLLFTGAAEMGVDTSPFRTDTPSHDEVLTVRAEHQQLVTDFLATVTPEVLAQERPNPWGPDDDWKPTVGDCVRTILEEEWAHLRYIRRDLAILRPSEAAASDQA